MANIKSNFPISLTSFSSSFVYGNSSPLKFCKILSISSSSSIRKLESSLLKSNTDIGSINTVEPLLDMSCTNPFTQLRYSSFTGITKRPLRIVTKFSLIYFEYVAECKIVFNFERISCSIFRSFLRISCNLADALSAIVSSSTIDFAKVATILGFIYSSSKYCFIAEKSDVSRKSFAK